MNRNLYWALAVLMLFFMFRSCSQVDELVALNTICTEKGGVMISGYCIDKSVIKELK